MSAEPAVPGKPSAVEGHKGEGRYLRGSIAEELANADSDHFAASDVSLIKFHGFYQQDDRDARKRRDRSATGKYYMFMVRCKIPGGRVTAKQYLALDKLTEEHANGTLRVTSRQGIQFHGVLKPGLTGLIGGINETLLTTLGACGDVNRNVMCTPAPFNTALYRQLQEATDRLASHFAPRTGAYHEIWLNGEKVANDKAEEPIYGKLYLPRKFKMGLALVEDNSVDVYAQDLGLLAVVEKDAIVGWNLLVGGGMGMTHNNHNTFPHIARPICYVPADQLIPGAEAVVKLFRDHGNRSDRKRARIKYLVHDWGVEKFREVLAGYLSQPLVLPKPIEAKEFPLHLGWNAQGDGKYWFGINIENGRIKDEERLKLKSALRKLVEKYQPEIRFTPMQDILLCDLPESAKADIESTLLAHGSPLEVSQIQLLSMACPAIPTCGLAISEAERALPTIVDQLETELAKLGLAEDKISIRMTGCPNGCVRPYQSDIGVVGRSGEKYTLFVGGNVLGNRLNFQLKDLVLIGDIVPTLSKLLTKYKAERQTGEGFGDYCQRLGAETCVALVA